MQIISSYGVELRKQNIPIRQTLEIYRSAVSYLIGIYVQVWEGLAEIRMQRGVLMLQNIWYILRRKIMPVLILISGSQRCLPICADLPSGMLWGQYPLIKHGWIYGKRQIERAGNQSLYMKITPCRSSTAMSCTVRERKGKTKHT